MHKDGHKPYRLWLLLGAPKLYPGGMGRWIRRERRKGERGREGVGGEGREKERERQRERRAAAFGNNPEASRDIIRFPGHCPDSVPRVTGRAIHCPV